jgi:nicotinamide riboside kinase
MLGKKYVEIVKDYLGSSKHQLKDIQIDFNMKIGLCGTVSVGKTTLVNALKELPEFANYEVATERSKYLRDQGVALNDDSTIKGQLVFAAERSLELMKENIITDRTVYDVSAFTLSAKSIEWWVRETFVNILMQLRKEYDVIIYVSPEGIEIEDNGVRTTNSEYRDKIDNVIKEMLIEFPPVKLIEVKGSTEERIASIKEILFS